MAKIKAGTYRFNDVLTAIPYDTLKMACSSDSFEPMITEYGVDIEPVNIEGYEVHRISPLNTFGDYYGESNTPTVLEPLMVVAINYEGTSACMFVFPAMVVSRIFTIPYDQDVSDEFEPWFTANTKRLSTITYNGSTIATMNGGQSATLKCKGMKMESDVVVDVAEISDSGGGDVEFNIAYGNSEPTDTSKLWVRAEKPNGVKISADFDGVETLHAGFSGLAHAAEYTAFAKVGTKIYLFGGYNKSSTLSSIQVFDTETREVSTLSAILPQAISGIAAAAVGTKIYLFGGYYNGSYLKTIQEFDTETETFSTLSSGLLRASAYITAVTVGEKVYLLGGRCKDGSYDLYLNTMCSFDPETGAVTDITAVSPGTFCGSAAVGTKIYLFGGGETSNSSGTKEYNYDYIQVLDTETGNRRWLTVRLPGTAVGIAAAAVGTKIYLFGGYSSEWSSMKKAVQVFDTETETLTTLSENLPLDTSHAVAVGDGTKVYVLGGSSGHTIKTSPYSYINAIHSFTVSSELPENTMLIEPSITENICTLMNADAQQMQIGVKGVYIGNAEGYAEKVAVALYKDGAWTDI